MKRTFSFRGPDGRMCERSIDSQHGKTLRLMIETAVSNRRHPAGEHGSYPNQFCPPGYVPTFMLRWPEHGGNAGDRRLRELVDWGKLRVDVRRYVDAAGDETATTVRRLDLSSVPDHVLRSFGFQRPAGADPGPPADAAFEAPVGIAAPVGDALAGCTVPETGLEGSIGGKPLERHLPREPSCSGFDAGAQVPRSGADEPVRPRPSPVASSPATLPAHGPNTEGARAPRAGEIFLAPHRLQAALEKEGTATVACFAVRGGNDVRWEVRWGYSLHLMLDQHKNLLAPERFAELVKATYRLRISPASRIRDRFFDEIGGLVRRGAVLLYGDHEPEGFRAAPIAAEMVIAVAKWMGLECRLVGDLGTDTNGATARPAADERKAS